MSAAQVTPKEQLNEALRAGPTKVAMIPLSALKPSKTNPRHEESLDDGFLADIATRGVQVPILARPLPDGVSFEIVYGHRRFYASKKAKKETIPGTIRVLSDDEAYEVQLIENLQRTDLHPLDEAEALGKLYGRHEKLGRTAAIELVAGTANKPLRYIAERLQLNHLVKEVKESFRKGAILLGHAIEVAKLEPVDQAEALKFLSKDQEVSTMQGWQKGVGASVETLKAWIQGNIMLDLGKAPFDTKDATLSKQYGACTDCSHRTGNNTSLFGDVGKGDFCTVPVDFFHKRRVTIDRKVEAMAKDRGVGKLLRVGMGDAYSNNSKSPWHVPVDLYIERGYGSAKLVASGDECPKTKAGIVVFMDRNIEGKMFAEVNVCTDAPNCPKHKGRESHRSSSTGESVSRPGVSADVRDDRRIQNLQSSIKGKQQDALIAAVCEKAIVFEKSINKKTLALIDHASTQMKEMLYGDRHRELAKNVFGIDPAKWREANKKTHSGSADEYDLMTETVIGNHPLAWMMAMTCMNSYSFGGDGGRGPLIELVSLLGVDAGKVRKQVSDEIGAKILAIKAQGAKRKARTALLSKSKTKAKAPKNQSTNAVKVAATGRTAKGPTSTTTQKPKAAKGRK